MSADRFIRLGCQAQHRGVWSANYISVACIPEINGGFSTAKAQDNSLIEIFVRRKSRRHPGHG